MAFGSADQLYFRTAIPPINDETAACYATVWKGERINAQLIVWSQDTVQQVKFKINEFVNERGKVLGKNNFQLQMVRYVLSNYPYGANNAVCGESS